VVGYGVEQPELEWSAGALVPDPQGTRCEIRHAGGTPRGAHVPLHGAFNVENALAAVATAEVLGVPPEESLPALAGFRGVKRRMEVRGEAAGVTVLDDFAHHPTAVEASIGAARARYPGRRLVAIFEPRTNTSRRALFQQRYAEAFDGADAVIVRAVPDGPIYSATGEVGERLSAERLAEDLRARGLEARALADVDAIVAEFARSARPGDVALVMSNGDFEGIWQKLLDALRD
jgi:UDP-N-acetylmuramate: L-alanyl-gamma-D-glutamyl-meso-diaminopimelate ligase